jgi:IS5 family transposase
VRRAILRPANVNESVVAAALPIGDETAVYADKGYDSAARHARLAERGHPTGPCGAATGRRPPARRSRRQPGDLALRDATHPQRLDQVID